MAGVLGTQHLAYQQCVYYIISTTLPSGRRPSLALRSRTSSSRRTYVSVIVLWASLYTPHHGVLCYQPSVAASQSVISLRAIGPSQLTRTTTTVGQQQSVQLNPDWL